MSICGQEFARDDAIATDEHHEKLGADGVPNPQELLIAGLNACLFVGFVTAAAAKGIAFTHLEVDTEGLSELREFLDPESGIAPGVDKLFTSFTLDGDGSDE